MLRSSRSGAVPFSTAVTNTRSSRRFKLHLRLLYSHSQPTKITASLKLKIIITLTGYKKKEQPHSLFWFTKFSRDMLYFQWKLITRKGEPLLAYLPSIAMMFCFGFHQSGRWRRGSGPLQGWRTGGDSCGGTVHKRAGRKQTVWDKLWTNI